MKKNRVIILLSLFWFSFFQLINAQRAEDYITISPDGAWCWFSDPRAVSYDGRLYTGWTSSKGDVVIGSYDFLTGKTASTIVYPEFQKDDHTAPALLFLSDGRLMVFFTKHNGELYYTVSWKPEDISGFEKIRKLDLGNMLCYTNPVLLSGENNRIYVFSRGGYNWKPSYIYSDDTGDTWSKPVIMVAKPGVSKFNRPYTKVVSDGKSAIYFAFTDGHPRNEICNSVYYMKYEHGKFYDAAGKVLGDTSSLPINQDLVPKVYDGNKTRIRSWIWDIAIDKDNHPVLVYATFPEDSKHVYNYARWDGTQWNNFTICRGGSWFPRFEKKKEDYEPEPHYSGGIYLDHKNPEVVYLSKPVNNRFEIFKYTTPDKGKTWNIKAVTSNSEHDNVRPFVVRDHVPGLLPGILWMNNIYYHHYTDFKSQIKGNKKLPPFSAELKKGDVTKVVKSVADWQIDHFKEDKYDPLDWTNGALYTGMMVWAQMAGNEKYINWLNNIGSKYHWQPYFRMYMADDFVVTQMYLDMYRLKNDKDMIMPVKARINWVIEHPLKSSLDFRQFNKHTLDRWSWCDALFMAPPVYAKLAAITGEKKYLKFMDKEYKATYNYLYDKDEHLFYRDSRYFNKRETNGNKVFWGRGNGWVMGGLVSILKELPEKSKYRPFYETLFKEIAAKVASLQNSEGYWHASLLDPESFPNPETSSSGFFCYALAYGINEGLLDKTKYLPVVEKAWEALVKAVYPDGKLGWVQPVGADPKKVTRDMTEVYGVGAFLLAGSEVYKLAAREDSNQIIPK